MYIHPLWFQRPCNKETFKRGEQTRFGLFLPTDQLKLPSAFASAIIPHTTMTRKCRRVRSSRSTLTFILISVSSLRPNPTAPADQRCLGIGTDAYPNSAFILSYFVLTVDVIIRSRNSSLIACQVILETKQVTRGFDAKSKGGDVRIQYTNTDSTLCVFTYSVPVLVCLC